jgi:L-asparagine transporter-like permease
MIYWRWRRARREGEAFSSRMIWGKTGVYITLILLGTLAISSLFVEDFRIGFYIAISISALVSSAYFIWKSRCIREL